MLVYDYDFDSAVNKTLEYVDLPEYWINSDVLGRS